MNAFDSVVYDSSAARALMPGGRPLGPWPEAACFRMDACPCEPDVLADMILSPR